MLATMDRNSHPLDNLELKNSNNNETKMIQSITTNNNNADNQIEIGESITVSDIIPSSSQQKNFNNQSKNFDQKTNDDNDNEEIDEIPKSSTKKIESNFIVNGHDTSNRKKSCLRCQRRRCRQQRRRGGHQQTTTNHLAIMIDDLFVRKLLHLICPTYFDENWLNRFKSQYLSSFTEFSTPRNGTECGNVSSTTKDNSMKCAQRKILDYVLSTNDLTPNDEILVFWKLEKNISNNNAIVDDDDEDGDDDDDDDEEQLEYNENDGSRNHNHHRHDPHDGDDGGGDPNDDEDGNDEHQHHHHHHDDDDEIEDRVEDMEYETTATIGSWIQKRDPMTYLFYFCELLMFVEGKLTTVQHKNLCQQLAREIRAYLYWISKDERFKEDSIEQEELSNNVHNGQQKLFDSILKHLLQLCHEMVIMFDVGNNNPGNAANNPAGAVAVAAVATSRQQNRLKFFQAFFNLLSRHKDRNDRMKLAASAPDELSESYLEWLRHLNAIIIGLVKYGDTPTINSHPVGTDRSLVVGKTNSILSDDTSKETSGATLANDNNNDERVSAGVEAKTPIYMSSEFFQSYTDTGGDSVPPIMASESLPPTSKLVSVQSKEPGGGEVQESASSNFVNSNAMMVVGSGTGVGSQTNTSTHVERNSNSSVTSNTSGPSSGVGSLDSHPSYQQQLFSKFLPTPASSSSAASSMSMTPSPANFATSMSGPMIDQNPVENDPNSSLSMILKNCKLEDLEEITNDALPPKLIPASSIGKLQPQQIDPPPASHQHQFEFHFDQRFDHHTDGGHTDRATFTNCSNSGDIFNSNTVVNESNHANVNTHSSSSVTNNGAVTGGAGTGGGFFNEFTINSLFSSFDYDNGSQGDQTVSIQDFTSALIKPYPPPDAENESTIPALPNQCFTMTLDDASHHESSLKFSSLATGKPMSAGQQPVSQGKPSSSGGGGLYDFVSSSSGLIQPTNSIQQHSPISPGVTNLVHQHQQSSHSNLDLTNELCERQTLYRLIISQLLFDGHRNIACQVAVAEHIKCDSFLIGPSQELHKLVTFAKAKKKEDILMEKRNSGDITTGGSGINFSRTASSGPSFYSEIGSSQASPAAMLAAQQQHPLRMPDENQYGKGIYEHGNSGSPHLGFGMTPNNGNPIFSNGNNLNHSASSLTPITPQSAGASNGPLMMEYADLHSSATELYSPPSAPVDYYYSNRSPEISNNQIGSMFTKPSGNELQSQTGQLARTATAGSVKCLPTSIGNGNELIMTEACLKNLNQLAKLNSNDLHGQTSSAINQQSALLGNGPMIFGRSASAMAMTSNNINGSNGGAPGTHSNVSRSPLTIKSPTNLPNHTTGNGKNHQIMQIVYKFGSLGQLKSQFSSPHGFCLGMNDEIIIADTNNHRICVYDKNGIFKQMFGNPGKDEGQLWYPRKITMIPSNFVRNNTNSPYYVICDRGMERSRMQIFTRSGNFVRKIPIRYIDIVAGIAINSRGHIVVVDSVSPTIYVITIENGALIEWRDCGDYMREPSDVAIFDDDYYICDFKGHCVVVIDSKGNFIRKIGMEGLTSFPNGIDISPTGDIFVGDSHGNKFHVVVFNRDGRLLAEYECPYCKVSRCCGLKLTKDNYIVTLAKNNHHVLILNPNFPH